MTLSEIAKEVLKLDKQRPVKIFYEGLRGEFYLGDTNDLRYVTEVGAPRAGYIFTLEELARDDWEMVA